MMKYLIVWLCASGQWSDSGATTCAKCVAGKFLSDVKSIGEGLKTNNTLTTLSLRNNNITDDTGIQSIIDG
jgi:hypothetical protein